MEELRKVAAEPLWVEVGRRAVSKRPKTVLETWGGAWEREEGRGKPGGVPWLGKGKELFAKGKVEGKDGRSPVWNGFVGFEEISLCARLGLQGVLGRLVKRGRCVNVFGGTVSERKTLG